MSIRTRSIKAAGWSAVQSVGSKSIDLIIFALLARLLLPDDWGLVAMATVFIAFFRLFIEQGLEQALIQRSDLEPAHLDTAFLVNLGMGTTFMILAIVCADMIASLYGYPELATVIRWLSLTLVIRSITSVQIAILKRELKFKPLAMRMLISSFAGGVVGVVMALGGAGVMSLVGMQLANSIMQVLVVWFSSTWRPTLRISTRHFRDLYSFGMNVIGISLLNFVIKYADTFLIGYFLGPTSLGYYHFASRLVQMVTQLINNISSPVAFSTFSTLQHDKNRLRKAYHEVVHLVSLLVFPVFAGLMFVAPVAVPTVFGNNWENSVVVFQCLAISGLVSGMFSFNANIMLASGQPNLKLKINLLNAIVNLVFISIAVNYSIEAVAMAVALRVLLLAPLPLVVVRTLINSSLRDYFFSILPALAASLIMCAHLYVGMHTLSILENSKFLLPVAIAAGGLVYIIYLLIFDRNVIAKIVEQFSHFKRS